MAISEAKRADLLKHIMDGKSLSDACRVKGMPSRSAVYEDLDADSEFADRYARACTVRADMLFDQMLNIADTPKMGEKRKISEDGSVEVTQGDMIEHRRLQVDARKWALAKMQPKKYGDKVAIGGAEDLPAIKHEDVTPGDKVKAHIDQIAKRLGAIGDPAEE